EIHAVPRAADGVRAITGVVGLLHLQARLAGVCVLDAALGFNGQGYGVALAHNQQAVGERRVSMATGVVDHAIQPESQPPGSSTRRDVLEYLYGMDHAAESANGCGQVQPLARPADHVRQSCTASFPQPFDMRCGGAAGAYYRAMSRI